MSTIATQTFTYSVDTLTVPLTTIFTRPSSCTSRWTYEAQFYNSVSGGLLLQNALTDPADTACFPSSFMNNGRVNSAQVYSPGACPLGYTTPALLQNNGATTAICCQSGFSYYTTYTTINFYESSSILFAGCISTYTGSGSPTSVPARDGNTLNSTTVTGPVTMWGQPLTVEYQASDLSLFTTSTIAIATKSPASTPSTLIALPSPPAASQPAPTTINTPVSKDSLGPGVIAGIAIGIGALSIALLAVAFLLFRRKRKQRRSQVPIGRMVEKPVDASYLKGHYAPAYEPMRGELMGQPVGELDGGSMSMREGGMGHAAGELDGRPMPAPRGELPG